MNRHPAGITRPVRLASMLVLAGFMLILAAPESALAHGAASGPAIAVHDDSLELAVTAEPGGKADVTAPLCCHGNSGAFCPTGFTAGAAAMVSAPAFDILHRRRPGRDLLPADNRGPPPTMPPDRPS